MTKEQKTERFLKMRDSNFNEFYRLDSLLEFSYKKTVGELVEGISKSRYARFKFSFENLEEFSKVTRLQLRDNILFPGDEPDPEFKETFVIQTTTGEFLKYFEAARNAPDLKHFMDSLSSIETHVPDFFPDSELKDFYEEVKSFV